MSEPLSVFEPWQPFREPFCATLLRTGTIALIAGLAIALSRHNLQRWPAAALLALWPSFGGHWVELFFLNILRPKLPPARAIQIPARLATWFAGGILLAIGLLLTARALPGFHAVQFPAWIGGVAFSAIELTVHAVMALRGLPNFYNGRR
jgi:hypothetical protein